MKKIVLLIIAFFMIRFTDFTVYAEDIRFTVIDGTVTVTGVDGDPEIIDIPPEYNGAPVVEIRDNAFYKCSSLKSISLPDSVKKMGHHCFFGCDSLEQIIIPDGVSEIGMGCFEGCSALNNAVLPENLAILPDSCFRGCASLSSVTLPQSVTEIQDFCFAGCSGLSDVSLSGRLIHIGNLAFFGCPLVQKIYIPGSVESIGTQALGYGSDGAFSGYSITGTPGSAAEKYAAENGFLFLEEPETKDAFAPQNSRNAPVRLPEIFIFAGLFFLIMAIISAFRNHKN